MRHFLLLIALGLDPATFQSVFAQTMPHGLNGDQVKTELNAAFFNATLPRDEINTYPDPPLNREIIARQRQRAFGQGREAERPN